MSGLDRYFSLLSLFGEARPVLTVSEMASAAGIPVSSVYRSVRELVAIGMLDPATEAHYRLGAVFLEFDRLIRLTDPLIVNGAPLLADLAAEARLPCVVALARLFGDRVMCVTDAVAPGGGIRTSYERGRPMPLMRGATSKTILAHLAPRRLTKLLDNPDVDPADLPLGSVEEFRSDLAAIRRRGFCVTRGEVDPGLVGLAVPVACPESAIVASLSLITEARLLDEAAERRLLLLLVSSGSLLADALKRQATAPAGD